MLRSVWRRARSAVRAIAATRGFTPALPVPVTAGAAARAGVAITVLAAAAVTVNTTNGAFRAITRYSSRNGNSNSGAGTVGVPGQSTRGGLLAIRNDLSRTQYGAQRLLAGRAR